MASKLKPPAWAKNLRKVTMKGKKGQKAVSFREGGLHKTTGTPLGQKISRSKMSKAFAGGYGPLGVKQAIMAKGMLAKGRKTATKKRK